MKKLLELLKSNKNQYPEVTLDLSPTAHEQSFTGDDRLRLIALMNLAIKNEMIKVHKNTKFKLTYTNTQGDKVTENIIITHSLLARPETGPNGERDMRYQISAKKVYIDQQEQRGLLGQGSFGKVKYARRYLDDDARNKLLKVKKIEQVVKVANISRHIVEGESIYESLKDWIVRSEEEIEKIEKERKIAERFHPQTRSVVSRYYDNENKLKIYLYMPYLGDSLDKCMDDIVALPLRKRFALISEFFKKLDAVHQQNILHLDLKPENVFVRETIDNDGNKNQIMNIGDFGLSRQINDPFVACGTAGFIAPEILKEIYEKNSGYSSTKSDIFSATGIVAQMFGADSTRLFLPLQYVLDNNNEFGYNLNNKTNNMQNLGEYNNIILNMLKKMCHRDDKLRPTAKICQYFFQYLAMDKKLSPITLLQRITDADATLIDEVRQDPAMQHAVRELFLILSDTKYVSEKKCLWDTLDTNQKLEIYRDYGCVHIFAEKLNLDLPAISLGLDAQHHHSDSVEQSIERLLVKTQNHIGSLLESDDAFREQSNKGFIAYKQLNESFKDKSLSSTCKLCILYALVKGKYEVFNQLNQFLEIKLQLTPRSLIKSIVYDFELDNISLRAVESAAIPLVSAIASGQKQRQDEHDEMVKENIENESLSSRLLTLKDRLNQTAMRVLVRRDAEAVQIRIGKRI